MNGCHMDTLTQRGHTVGVGEALDNLKFTQPDTVCAATRPLMNARDPRAFFLKRCGFFENSLETNTDPLVGILFLTFLRPL